MPHFKQTAHLECSLEVSGMIFFYLLLCVEEAEICLKWNLFCGFAACCHAARQQAEPITGCQVNDTTCHRSLAALSCLQSGQAVIQAQKQQHNGSTLCNCSFLFSKHNSFMYFLSVEPGLSWIYDKEKQMVHSVISLSSWNQAKTTLVIFVLLLLITLCCR